MTIEAVVFGAGGMLATAMARAVELRERSDGEFRFFTEQEVDLRDVGRVEAVLDETRPLWVVNAAAYTAVDQAEREQERAFQINERCAAMLAERCRARGIRLLHVSTDYVFGGGDEGRWRPYAEEDAAEPVNVYGQSKLAGEEVVRTSGVEHVIARSSWMFAPWGRNFVRTVFERISQGGDEVVKVVDDQRGRPTSANDLAGMLVELMRTSFRGTIHVCNDGEATWYELACAVRDAAGLTAPIKACRTNEYPRAARRPTYSVLSIERLAKVLGRRPRHWREALGETVRSMMVRSERGRRE